MKTTIILMAKEAKPGSVKTRLAKVVGDPAAYETYLKLLNYTLDLLSDTHFNTVLSVQGDLGEKHEFDLQFQQVKGNLGDKMLNAFQLSEQEFSTPMIMIGSDCIDLKHKHLDEAAKSLRSHDVVFGPSSDGGYYLIGMKKLIPDLMKNMPWSQANLMDESLNFCRENNLKFHLLETLNDIDTFEDLKSSSLFDWFKIKFAGSIDLESHG